MEVRTEDHIMEKILVTNWASKIEPHSQITHFDTPPRYRFFGGDRWSLVMPPSEKPTPTPTTLSVVS